MLPQERGGPPTHVLDYWTWRRSSKRLGGTLSPKNLKHSPEGLEITPPMEPVLATWSQAPSVKMNQVECRAFSILRGGPLRTRCFKNCKALLLESSRFLAARGPVHMRPIVLTAALATLPKVDPFKKYHASSQPLCILCPRGVGTQKGLKLIVEFFTPVLCVPHQNVSFCKFPCVNLQAQRLELGRKGKAFMPFCGILHAL